MYIYIYSVYVLYHIYSIYHKPLKTIVNPAVNQLSYVSSTTLSNSQQYPRRFKIPHWWYMFPIHKTWSSGIMIFETTSQTGLAKTYTIHLIWAAIIKNHHPFKGGTYPKCKLHFSRCFRGGPWKCKLTFWRYFDDPPHKIDTWGTFSDQIYI